jgi:ankyrin repeat protein
VDIERVDIGEKSQSTLCRKSWVVQNGADINCMDTNGQTIFHEVARSWNVDVARFLVENGKCLVWKREGIGGKVFFLSGNRPVGVGAQNFLQDYMNKYGKITKLLFVTVLN